MKIVHRILVLSGLAALSLSFQVTLSAQNERLRKLDSLMNPVTDSSGKFLQFDEMIIDAGQLKEEGSPSEYIFRWKNVSSRDITVVDVKTGCRCAVPSFEVKSVKPGETSEIKVTYYPKGHPGSFNRKFPVYTDMSGGRPAVVLELKGHVEPAVMPTWNFPVAMGPLLLKRSQVSFSGDKLQVERILCLNAGDKPLEIKAMEALLPPFLELRCDPETVLPGKQADLIVRFCPDKAVAKIPGRIPVILDGLLLPPTQRTITVIIE